MLFRSPSRSEGKGSTGGVANGAGSGVDLQNVALTGDLVGTLRAEALKRGNTGTALLDQPYEVANCLTARMQKGINTTLDEGQTPVICAAPTVGPTAAWIRCD